MCPWRRMCKSPTEVSQSQRRTNKGILHGKQNYGPTKGLPTSLWVMNALSGYRDVSTEDPGLCFVPRLLFSQLEVFLETSWPLITIVFWRYRCRSQTTCFNLYQVFLSSPLAQTTSL
jgi:hypothetical protein